MLKRSSERVLSGQDLGSLSASDDGDLALKVDEICQRVELAGEEVAHGLRRAKVSEWKMGYVLAKSMRKTFS